VPEFPFFPPSKTLLLLSFIDHPSIKKKQTKVLNLERYGGDYHENKEKDQIHLQEPDFGGDFRLFR
jgi:hypothetical protein